MVPVFNGHVVELWFFYVNDRATTGIYTLSLHDALPICLKIISEIGIDAIRRRSLVQTDHIIARADRKSTRLNSSHGYISYAVFCLKKTTQTKSSTSSTPDFRQRSLPRRLSRPDSTCRHR